MSRAFVKEDSTGGPPRDFHLPDRDDPDYDRVAAHVLLEAARNGDTDAAEEGTGYRWGEPRLAVYVRELLREAERAGDDRLVQLAHRYLK